jgi:Carboxypeptidase regulatory-like domain
MSIRTFLFVFLFAVSMSAQTFHGNLTGAVTDASGAVIPEVTVTLTNPSTGLTRTTVTTSSGDYSFPELPVGVYSIAVSHSGFEPEKIDNIAVAVSQTTNINVQLGVARQAQTVEVSAAAVNLETNSSDLSALVNTSTVADLPNNGRDFRTMVQMAPGVAGSSVNGSRTTANNYQIDGADNNDVALGISAENQGGVAGIPGGLLPIDAIDQFSVQTNAEADMGRNGGSNVNMVIKSGTNDLHGSAYYFNRNEDLASASPILPKGSRPQEVRNNQPGFSLGGPIKKNKTFFFLDGEIQLAIAGESILDTTPSPAWVAAGDAVLARYGVPVNPVSTNLLTIFPSYALTGPATANNYLADALDTYNSFNGIVKVDHRFNDKHSIAARYLGSAGTQIADVGSHFVEFFQAAPMHIHNFSVVETAIFTPTLVNTLTLGENYFMQTFNDHNIGYDPLALGLNTGSTSPGSPGIHISGFDYVGATQPSARTDTTGHATDNLAYTVGRHQFKFGGEYRRAVVDLAYFGGIRGSFTFDGTRGPWASDPSISGTLKSLSDFLAGYPTNANGATITRGLPEPVFLINSGDAWATDTFKATPELSLNYGLRYTYYGVVHDVGNTLTNFLPSVGFVGGQLYPKQLLNFSPRFGFAYSPRWAKRFVLRGGYGVFYDVQPLQNIYSGPTGNGGASGIQKNPGGPDPVYTLSAMNVVFQSGAPVFGGATPVPPFGAFSVGQNYHTPYVQNFHLNIQTQLSKTTLLQVGYVGSLGRQLPVDLDINQPVIGTGGIRPLAQQYPMLSAINQTVEGANSAYNSMQTSVHQQFWNGLTANMNFTWSHAIDDASSATTPMNSYNLEADRGNSTFDEALVLTGFITYRVPQLAHFAPRLTNGWQLNSRITYDSGTPLNFKTGQNTDGTGEENDRDNLVGNPYANVPVLTGTQAVQYFNPAAFAIPAKNTYGNLGRDALYGPGFGSVDFSIFKRIPIHERVYAEFRAEIFNILNRTNWASPSTSITSASFGEMTQTKNGSSAPGLGFGEPRNTQLGLKLIF